ncbi:ABC transporter permease [Pseudoxanthobacter sp. M-2]|uniref:ABC transporter permease n=1 Tax=Pseudoxanthobacter sp. M-2 TaxID=3078754 RepID=UPI0038FD098A
MYKIQPDDRKVVEEFRRNPIGRHSPQLQRVLNLFRGAPMEGKYVLITRIPHKEWVLGQMTGKRGEPIRMTNQVFHNIEEVEWYVFRQRWKLHTGEDLEE